MLTYGWACIGLESSALWEGAHGVASLALSEPTKLHPLANKLLLLDPIKRGPKA